MEYYMGEDPIWDFNISKMKMSEEEAIEAAESKQVELTTNHKTDVEKLRKMTEEEIVNAAESDPDALPTDKEFWKDAKLVEPTNYDKFIQRLAADAGITFESAKAMGLIELKRLVQENHKPYTPDPMDVSKVIANVRLQEAYSQGMFFREGF